MSIRIRLTDDELARAHYIATAYGRVKYRGQSAKSRLSKSSQYEVDFAGACGRIAFIERFLGRELNVEAYINGDKKPHATLVDGRTIDVKVSRKPGGPLALGGDKQGMNLRSDVVGLAAVPEAMAQPLRGIKGWDGRTVRLIGWVTAEEFLARCRKRDLGHGVRDVVIRTQLNHDFNELLGMVQGVLL